MNRDDVIHIANQTNLRHMFHLNKNASPGMCRPEDIEQFAALVAAHEREALLDAAKEIERLRLLLAEAYANMAPEYFEFVEPLLALPDDTALKEIIQQAKREVLEAADKCDEGYRIRARSAT